MIDIPAIRTRLEANWVWPISGPELAEAFSLLDELEALRASVASLRAERDRLTAQFLRDAPEGGDR